MSESDEQRYDLRTRRALLKAGAVGGMGLLAGCPASGGSTGGATPTETGTTPNSGSGDGTKVYDATFTVLDRAGTPPSERHFNPWNPSTSGCWFPGAIVYDRLAVYSPAANENFPLIATSWSMPEDRVLEVELSDEWKWHNGDQFVAQDWVMQQQIEKEIANANNEGGKATPYESVEALDDTHIRITLYQPLSETFAVSRTIASGQGFLGRGEFVKHDVEQWKDWHERLQDSSGSTKDDVIQEITSSSYPSITSDEEWVGNGPFQVRTVGDNNIVMERFEGHPESDDINFSQYELFVPGNIGQVFQPYANGVVDATPKGFPVKKSLRSQLPEQTELFREALSANKLFCFNLGQDVDYESPVNNRNVRKALCHVFDRSAVKNLLRGALRRFRWAPCRIPGKVLAADSHPATELVKEKFTKYGQNDTQRAAELLRREGYERNDRGNWFGPDGRPFQISILNAASRPDFGVWVKNLKDFGVLVKQEQVDSATFDERRKKGEYDIIPDGSSANGVAAMWKPSLIIDWLLKTLTHGSLTAEIPMPIGDPDGSSGTKEINVREHINKWRTTGDAQYHHELMWWWNQHLPQMETMFKPDAGAINTKHWDFSGTPEAVVDGVDDALFVAPKLDQGTLKYTP